MGSPYRLPGNRRRDFLTAQCGSLLQRTAAAPVAGEGESAVFAKVQLNKDKDELTKCGALPKSNCSSPQL
jgi:hypothetical protein